VFFVGFFLLVFFFFLFFSLVACLLFFPPLYLLFFVLLGFVAFSYGIFRFLCLFTCFCFGFVCVFVCLLLYLGISRFLYIIFCGGFLFFVSFADRNPSGTSSDLLYVTRHFIF
jgi:hypothetical protein